VVNPTLSKAVFNAISCYLAEYSARTVADSPEGPGGFSVFFGLFNGSGQPPGWGISNRDRRQPDMPPD
jgi:hypothetical protein